MGHIQAGERATVKYGRFLHILLSVGVVMSFYAPGRRCLADARDVSAPVLHRTGHFFIVSESDLLSSPTLGALLEAIYSKVFGAMASHGLVLKTTTVPLVWRCFDDREQYRRHALHVEYASPAFVEAYYSTRTNRVVWFCDALPVVRRAVGETSSYPAVMRSDALQPDQGAGTVSAEQLVVLTHEMTHQLAYNSGLQKRGVMYPLWVSEGLATFFEGCALPRDGRVFGTSRRQRLARLATTGDLLDLDDLVVLAGSEALGSSPADLYAQCWGLMAFLLQHHPAALSAYLADFAESPVGRRSSASLRRDFVKYFGRIDTLERPWRAFIASLQGSEAAVEGQGSVTAAAGI